MGWINSRRQEAVMGAGESSNPRRAYLRHTAQVPLQVERTNETSREESRNVGHGGLAFVAHACPRVGEILRIRIDAVSPPFEGDARVAWCRREDEEWLVGIQFLDAAAAFRSRMVQQVCSIENYRREVEAREGRTLTPQAAAAEWIARYAGRFPDTEVAGDDAVP